MYHPPVIRFELCILLQPFIDLIQFDGPPVSFGRYTQLPRGRAERERFRDFGQMPYFKISREPR